MPNICFLLGGFQGNGGIGRVTSVLANALAEERVNTVTTVSYVQKNNVSRLYKTSDKLHSYYLLDSGISMTKAFLTKHIIRKTRRILIEENIDILVACGALYYPLGMFSVKGLKTRCFCWEHTNPEVGLDYRFQRICRKLAVRFADKVIVLTKSAEQYYKHVLKIDPPRLEQIYNPIAEEASKSQKYDLSSKKIISVGRLSYPKNFNLLLDIASTVFSKYPDWLWDIYGTGEEYDALSEKISALSLQGRVRLMGQVDDIYERYRDYSMLVMTSRYEGFPMTLIEGAVNRLPLISFDIKTGPDEIITDGENGFLIPADDARKMEEKIEFLITHPKERKEMSENAFASVEKFRMAGILTQWSKLCHSR